MGVGPVALATGVETDGDEESAHETRTAAAKIAATSLTDLFAMSALGKRLSDYFVPFERSKAAISSMLRMTRMPSLMAGWFHVLPSMAGNRVSS